MQKHPDLPQAFADLGVETRFLKALRKIGFSEPSEIQRELIPIALEGKDVFGQARTGTGKTAAFGLPILQQIKPSERLQAICLAPTRELAVQVTTMLRQLESAVRLRKQVTTRYRKRSATSDEQRILDPYGLVYRRGGWILVARSEERDDIRNFRVDRIELF